MTSTRTAPIAALLLTALLLPVCRPARIVAAPPRGDGGRAGGELVLHSFERRRLSDVFYSEGATFGDVSRDGIADIISGPFWYEGPDFETAHAYYEPKPYDPKGYSNNFFAFVLDFNADGWNDILIIGFPGKDASWFENPRGGSGYWERHVVFNVVDNESPTFSDLTGDGKPELVCQTGGRFGYASPDWSHPERPWRFVAISKNRKLGRFTHGLGIGDVNGDGRLDMLERSGWYEQPASLDGDPLWTHHAFTFSTRGGAQMYAYDIDGDGDNDVLTSLHAHGKGLAWYENLGPAGDGKRDGDGGEIDFRPHIIMDGPLANRERWEGSDSELDLQPTYAVEFSNLHAIDLVDIDGDGLRDIVTGKRFWAHFTEPEAGGIAVSYWFKLVRGPEGADFVPYMIDDDSGIGTQVVAGDVNGDGLPDVVVGNKKGTFYLEHRRRKVTRDEWLEAQPEKRPKKPIFYLGGLPASKAAAVMTVPEGFEVSLIASEPRLHQPVAFTIDERGRLWVLEAYTYPKRVKGAEGKWNEGNDDIVIFSDENGDGSFETRKVFTRGINLGSGLEVGFGGVWVGAAPYLLFFPDRDHDDVPDGDPEIVLDGFGFHDTHETLNSFIWGPDGWLYGCHGVFTHSLVGAPGTPPEKRVPLNAGYWRYHPLQRRFEVFAWGTSNPWGIDFDDRGQAFATACVIPHLYHVIQGARYQRQAGRHFNPHVYDDIKTIADHLHYAGDIRDHAWWGHEPRTPEATLAAGGGHAHCGALVYLGDDFPEEYRNRLFVDNIHGNRVNTEILERRGSGFVGHHGKDLLVANNNWFRGIDLQCGPDGGVYLIDWYDKNACHRTLPSVWDRTNGRLYKITYGRPAPRKVDLARLDDEELAGKLLETNDWYARTARRLLQERGGSEAARRRLLDILEKNPDATRKLRALWALHVTGGIDEKLALETLASPHEYLRGWTIQLITEDRAVSRAEARRLVDLAAKDPSPVVRLYLASALQRLPDSDAFPIAERLLAHAEDAGDHNLPLMIWYGVEPLAGRHPERAMELAAVTRIPLVRRYIIRRVASIVSDLEPVIRALARASDDGTRALILEEMLEAFKGHADIPMPASWPAVFDRLARSSSPSVLDALRAVAVRLGDSHVFPLLRARLADRSAPLDKRRADLEVLLAGRDPELPAVLRRLLDDPGLRREALRALAAFGDPATAPAILKRYPALSDEEKRDAINTLSTRPAFAVELLTAVRKGIVPRRDLGAFTIRQLRGLRDPKVDGLIENVWGVVRESSADKVALVKKYEAMLTPKALESADLSNGRAIFDRTCGQCHVLFGSGKGVAPDLTGSNRANLDYLLTNVLDPNAVVGKDYQMHVYVLRDGRVVSGLPIGETDTAITVQTINDEVVIAKKDIVQRQSSTTSLMPEGLFAQLSPAEVRDLVAYLGSPAQVPVPGAKATIDPKTHRVAGAIEGERLSIVAKTRGTAREQGMASFGRDLWSGNAQLWWTGARPGDRLSLAITVPESGRYALDAALTKARDYGIVQLSWDGTKLGGPLDLYDPAVIPTGPLHLGELEIEKGRHQLGVEIVGADPRAVKAYMFGLDYVLLRRK